MRRLSRYSEKQFCAHHRPVPYQHQLYPSHSIKLPYTPFPTDPNFPVDPHRRMITRTGLTSQNYPILPKTLPSHRLLLPHTDSPALRLLPANPYILRPDHYRWPAYYVVCEHTFCMGTWTVVWHPRYFLRSTQFLT